MAGYSEKAMYRDGVAFFDFDGCISICNWRENLLPSHGWPNGYEDFHEMLKFDPPNEWIIQMMHDMMKDGIRVIILTGRVESTRRSSEKWLVKFGVKYHWMEMRKDGDKRPSEIIKAAYIERFHKECIKMIFDDRQKIIDHLRELGYPVCKVEARV